MNIKTAATFAIATFIFQPVYATDCFAQVYKGADESYANDKSVPGEPAGGAAKTAADNSKGVEVVGENIEITNSPSGLARVKASLKNNFSYAVEGVRLEVIFILGVKKKTEPMPLAYTGGKLAPGETGVIDQEINYRPDQIHGYQYQVNWSFFKGSGGQEETSGESVSPQ